MTVRRHLLALLVHARLRWHRVCALGLLLLLQIRLVLHGLLVVCGHVGLWVGVAWHVGLWHALLHGWWGRVGFLWRFDSRLAIDTVGIRRLRRVETGL